MQINFDTMMNTVMPNMWGGEKEYVARMHTDHHVKIMRGVLVPGASIGLHTHKTNSEIIYVLSGCGKMIYNETVEFLKAGDCHYGPKGCSHSFINKSDEDLVFFAVVPEHPDT